VGIGALGGTIATRALSARMPVWLATRTAKSARELRLSGLRVSGIGGDAAAEAIRVAAIEEYEKADQFDLILLATKAHDALEIAPFLSSLLLPGGTLLPIQNGSVSQILGDRLGDNVVLGGLSNLGATMVKPGMYEQRNAGNLLIGELTGDLSDRVKTIAQALSGAIETRLTPNLRGALWAKLLLNCSVTTIGAIAAQTMRQYMISFAGKEVYWCGQDHDAWIDQILAAYGDLKPSMLQDFELGRRTEIDFINGYVVQLGTQIGIPIAMNAAMADMVHQIEQGQIQPLPARLDDLLRRASRTSAWVTLRCWRGGRHSMLTRYRRES
jgi:2-dehydropantoate 2-reductase